jgi:hypothetical protein
MNTQNRAIDALLAVRPVWSGLAAAASVVGLEGRWLLHAGPPLSDPCHPPAPILSSAVLACLHEGWAENEAAAEHAVRAGSIRFEPAQHHRCVTPLAALISPGTRLVAVQEESSRVRPVHAPLTTLGGPDLRFGTRDPRILERLRLRDTLWTDLLGRLLAEPIALLPIAAQAIAEGDDLHNRTTTATRLLAERLATRMHGTQIDAQKSESLLQGLASTPLFFLSLWMAAGKLILSATEHSEPRTLITRMGGNGEVFGIAVAGRPDAWCSLPALAPKGPYLDPALSTHGTLGAIGDSAVIDVLGFGGQALVFAPEPRAALEPYLPPGSVPSSLPLAAHPAFAATGLRVGIDAARIADGSVSPVITLGMVEKTGTQGLLGRGVMTPPCELFVNAVKEVS